MTKSTTPTADAHLEDCPLPISVQNRNICCFATFWSVYYLAAPVSYIGLTHANLLKAFGNSDTISNLPSAVYLWLTALPVLAAWIFPHARHLKPLALVSVGLMVSITAAVAITLSSEVANAIALTFHSLSISFSFLKGFRLAFGEQVNITYGTLIVILHGAVFGAANGILLTAMWDFLRRGVSTSRRGKALGLTFGVGPLLACVGALMQDLMFDGKLFGGWSFGLKFPNNYMTLFAVVSPLLLIAGGAVAMFRIPIDAASEKGSGTPLSEIAAGLRQFVRNRNVLLAVVIYVIVYSGGNAIFQNVSLHAQSVLGSESNTLGLQSFLRFGFKAVAGAMLGWLLATASPRATLLATTSILLIGMTWALSSTGWWFMLTFGLLGAGELFGAYFPNYVTTASRKSFVRINMAYLNVLTAFTGFSSLIFGAIADAYGRIASFYASAGMLLFAMVLICLLLPGNPTPQEDVTEPSTPA